MSKSIDDAIRIRDNQRRSRARRKDLVKELQTRVQEYELKGVTATQEMQRAARRVAQENERLRILLTRHGILKEEIDSFLRSYETTQDSAETALQVSHGRSPTAPNQYAFTRGPRSLHATPLSPAYPKDNSPRPSPAQIPRQAAQISRQECQPHNSRAGCGPATQCGPTTIIPPKPHSEAVIMSRPVEACRQAESYYVSPSETDSSSPPSRPQDSRPVFTHAEHAPVTTHSQGWCPPPRVAVEDPDCPSTADCFCPPTATVQSTCASGVGNDEISCETAATIIAQMRGDGDDAAARASIGCDAGEVCQIKNSFLMQILDER